MNKLLDLYSDYLISSFGQTTATGLSKLLDGAFSHDQITRFLAKAPHSSADLWQIVKPHIRQIESAEGVLIIDDSIEEKPSSDENEIVCWHYDHTKGSNVKGINFMSAVYHNRNSTLPVAYSIIEKSERYIDKKDGKEKRRSPVSKNEYYRQMTQQAVENQIQFRYVLNDIWFASADNMMHVKHSLKKEFVMPIKSNRNVALSLSEKLQGRFVKVESLTLQANTTWEVYLEGVDFPLLLLQQVFINGDGSIGILYLVTSDLTLTYEQITAIYRKRWNVEPYHKSLKQNASLEKSPTHTVFSQTTHFFAALCAYIKLELLKTSTKLNHFALKTKLYINATKAALTALREIQSSAVTA
jgi:hypothetical protein